MSGGEWEKTGLEGPSGAPASGCERAATLIARLQGRRSAQDRQSAAKPCPAAYAVGPPRVPSLTRLPNPHAAFAGRLQHH